MKGNVLMEKYVERNEFQYNEYCVGSSTSLLCIATIVDTMVDIKLIIQLLL